jgi:5-methylcytosine-specific restriction endonuclease McrA
VSRREFSKPVKREALKRAAGCCEGTLTDGTRCNGVLADGRFHFDHDIPDALGGEPELWNCKVLCLVCHGTKTAKHDVPTIAKAKRVDDRFKGIRKPSTLRSRNTIGTAGAQHRATGKVDKWRGYAP